MKSFLTVSLLLSAMIFNFTACSSDAESSSNELSGKTFVCDFGDYTQTFNFDDDIFTITYQTLVNEMPGIDKAFISKEVITYSYSLNSDLGYILAKEKNFKTYYIRDNKTLYTESELYPETFQQYKNTRKAFYKALNPALTDSQLNDLVNQELADWHLNESNYDITKYNNNVKYCKYAREFFLTIPYKLENTKLLLGDIDSNIIPYDLNFEDIFNGRYYYFSSNTHNGNDSQEFILNNTYACLAKTYPGIEIHLDQDNVHIYSILSVKDNNMKIVEVSDSNRDNRKVFLYNESEAFNCPITYTEGKDKVTAKIKLNGKSYSFDIKYTSKKEIAELLKEENDTYILKD